MHVVELHWRLLSGKAMTCRTVAAGRQSHLSVGESTAGGGAVLVSAIGEPQVPRDREVGLLQELDGTPEPLSCFLLLVPTHKLRP